MRCSLLLLVPAVAAADPVVIGGYFEADYQAHFQNPSNRITNLRGFDNRSRTFTLSNVAIDAKAENGPITAHLVLQIGHTPSTYYLAEPTSMGTSSVDTSSSELWKYVQAANVTAQAPRGFTIEAGLFPSPVGLEPIAVKDNWNWSRSNLFFGLPFYHTGVMLSHAIGRGWSGKLHVYNGWNSVVDNNDSPSVAASASYASEGMTAQLLYFGGIERDDWRHLFDATATVAITDDVAVAGQLDAGVEHDARWAAAAAYAKVGLAKTMYVAVRGDYFYEHVPEGGTAIFWPTKWVAESTATFAYQPVANVSARLEYRHDHANSDVYFGGGVVMDAPNRRMQDTVTLGVTAWF